MYIHQNLHFENLTQKQYFLYLQVRESKKISGIKIREKSMSVDTLLKTKYVRSYGKQQKLKMDILFFQIFSIG